MEHNLDDLYWKGFLKSIPRRKLFLTLIYGILRVAVSTVWPYLLFNYIKHNPSITAQGVITMVAVIIAIFAIAGFTARRQLLLNIGIMEDFSTSLVERMWKKMAGLDWLTFHAKARVYFLDAIMMDAWRLRHGMLALLEVIIVNVIIAAMLTFFTLFISPRLFVLCLVSQLVVGGIHLLSNRSTRPYVKRFHAAWRSQHLWMAKAVDQFDLIKMGRGYAESENNNRQSTKEFIACNSAMLKQQMKWVNINQIAGNIMRVIVFVAGLYWVQLQYIHLADLLMVLLIVSVVQSNLSQLPKAGNSLMEAQEARENIIAFFSLPNEKQAVEPLPAGVLPVEKISMQGVTFAYGDKAVINEYDILLEKGKIYLWRGKNGSGKSTTAHILLGLITPQGGVVNINGKTVSWDMYKQLRRRFAFIDQDAHLFMGSIKENVIFGHPLNDAAWRAVHNSWVHHLLPLNNLDGKREVGDMGEGLSGGESKRLILIREWIYSSDLFILDEPLNHLDEYAIEKIKEEIINIKSNCIVIIISHQKGFETIADETREF